MKLTNLFILFPAIGGLVSASRPSCSGPAPEATNFTRLGLEFDFHAYVTLEPRITVGYGPWGRRSWIDFSGGTFCAKWNNGTTGTFVSGGQDANVAVNNGTGPTWLQTNYLLKTDDEEPAYIFFQTSGWSGKTWRLFIKLETGDPRYYDLNFGMWVAGLTERGANNSAVGYDAYRLT